ncbi:MMPL family transporter [Wenjunlia tyrosinilytica]|uniref:Membrane protein n=1 Tax=Wenjunlia tyrosinilytica TaxID=1544741 RepID=A0A917ZN26_9ACTN|nr:MMPL family transporter [Wenjunlia tyrosinilytica]GGO87092.1 membrane protein [Wenjunlia tyrosinilytica]
MRDNLAARLGGWSARHRKTAIFGWLLFVVAAVLVGGMVGQDKMDDYENGAGDSARAQRILFDAGIKDPASEMVIVGSTEAGGWRAAAKAVTEGIRHTGRAVGIKAPVVSENGRDALIRFDLTGDPDKAGDRVAPILDAVKKAQADHPEASIGEFGDGSAQHWLDKILGDDFASAELTAVPVALGILLVAFGALMAAVLPVGLAITAFLAANGLLVLASHTMHVADTTASVMLLMGLAVGVDYCLFYLRRERDERAAGRDKETALRIAAATSGRAVLVSGLTVMVAMAGMFFSGLLLFKGFAIATILVVFIAMLGSVTVLPALLSLLGDRIEFGRIPFLNSRKRAGRPRGRFIGAVLRPVLARPKVFALVAAGVLLALAAPALGMKTEQIGLERQVASDHPLATSYKRITHSFPGGPAPAQIVVEADDIRSPKVRDAIADLESAVARSQEFGKPVTVRVHPAQNVAQIDIPLAGDGTGAVSRHALSTLREDVVPSTVGKVSTAYVDGELAGSLDFSDQLGKDITPVLLFVTGVTFLLMLVSFRSVVVAATSIALNLLSVAAAFGVMVAVFQHGWGADLFGTEKAGAIESWMPLFVLVVLFGLSMDYHVFVVSRIREARDRGMTTADAVAHGVRSTAGAVTSAAVIMVAVFSVFATLSMQDMKQMGVGLAVAVLLDATVIRTLLLPALMTLLGERNWYLPRWLGWLPHLSHGEESGPDAQADGPGHALVPPIPVRTQR